LIKRPGIDLPEPLEHDAFAFGIAKWELCGLFECPDFQRESRPYVQEPKQFGIDFVYFSSPVLYVHNSAPGNKKTSRDFQDRGWLVEGVVLLGRQHIGFKLRLPLSSVKKKR
jgi:hypothetical protein